MSFKSRHSATIYLIGKRSETNQLQLPLPSAAVLFLLHYCDVNTFDVIFVDDGQSSANNRVMMEFSVLLAVKHRFIHISQCPLHCDLPGMEENRRKMVRLGLCSVVRHIIAVAHSQDASQHLDDLLGFRGGSLKACAEVSGWTKLCEIELPESVGLLLKHVREKKPNSNDSKSIVTLELPENVMKLEWHFIKPVKIHNDDKKKRKLLSEIKQEVKDLQDVSDFKTERDIPCAHCTVRYRIHMGEQKCDGCDANQNSEKTMKSQPISDGHPKNVPSTLSDLCSLVESITIRDIEFLHLYSEGIDITVADLLLFTYMYFLLTELGIEEKDLQNDLPKILSWFQRMISLPRIQQTSSKCQFNLQLIFENRMGSDSSSRYHFVIPDYVRPAEDDEMELSRRSRGKYRAIKPDVTHAIEKIKKGKVMISVSDHPKGDNIKLDWLSFPNRVDPGKDLPGKRLLRKREQLENLVTAVIDIAKSGDIIVDFCSGGGHLGIVIAYLLPDCKVYLIENNEESLKIARQRLEELNLDNVVVYQCNQDYFHGYFNIGVCLHACGVATDMVLQQCIQNNASFVICPCCYGGIQETHYITYPRSQQFIKSGIGYKEYLTLGHVADQTEFNIALEEQGKYCMNLVDTDRSMYATEHGYSVTLCSLKPLSCTPKNNLLIGTL